MASGSGDGGNKKSDIPRGLINRSGNPIGRGSRLPSVKGHRDLTLGGIQRKVFIPNLAAVKKTVVKDESKTTSPETSKPEKSKGRGGGRGRGERGRGRGRGRGEDRTIQLQSEFSYGPIGDQTKSGSWSRGSFGGAGGGGSGGARQKESEMQSLRTKIKQDISTESDEKTLENLMRDDFLSDISSGDAHLKPIKIPLNCNNSIKQEIKEEPKDESMDTDSDPKPEEKIPDVKQSYHINSKNKNSSDEKSTVTSIFREAVKSEKGELLILQFPDTLPGFPNEAADEKAKTSKDSEISNKLSLCQLKDCNEGFMGKLRIRKSGKAELCLGENIMKVLPGRQVNFHQELVSINTTVTPRDMTVLGSIKHKLVVSPDYNCLLQTTKHF